MFQNYKIIILAALFASCSPLKYVPVQEKTIIEYRDSVVIHTDTVKVNVPYEVIKEVVPQMDTLEMETSIAKSVSYLDTNTLTLKGRLENKPVALEKEIFYKDKLVYRDTIKIKEVPVEIEVEKKVTPTWCWYSLGFNIIILLIIALIIFIKLKI